MPVQALQACTEQQVNIPLAAVGGQGPFQWFSAPQVPSLVLEQDSTRRALLRGTLTATGSFELTVGVRDARSCASFVLPIDVAETPAISGALPDACVGQPVEAVLTGQGGRVDRYAWTYAGPAGLEQDGPRVFGRAPSTPGDYPVQITLRDDQCPVAGAPPVSIDTLWSVRAEGECPRIVSTVLPAPCAGIPYSRALVASAGSGSGYAWSVLADELPAGLSFDAANAVVYGTPTGASRSGSLEVLLTDSAGQRAVARLDLSLRDDCRLAWIAGDPARLNLGDVFLSAEPLELPRGLAADAVVRDMRFSPDGAWLAFRAGPSGGEGLYLYSMASPPAADAGALPFACPSLTAACAVLDYAWSDDGRHLAVVLSGDGAQREYVSGVSLDSTQAIAQWPVVGTATRDGVDVDLDYVRDVVWAPGDRFGFVGSSGQVTTPHTLYVAPAGLTTAVLSANYADADLRLRSVRTGWAAFDAFYYTMTSLDPPDRIAQLGVAWTSPSGAYAAAISPDGALSMFAIENALEPLATTDTETCAVLVAWAPAIGGRETVLCSSGSLDAPDGGRLTVFVFDTALRRFDPPAGREVPTNGENEQAPLTNTRRFFSASGEWLSFGAPGSGVTLLSVLSNSSGLPRPTLTLSVDAPAELRFAPDGRSLLVYDQNGFRRSPVPPGPSGSILSRDASARLVPPPNLATCEEAIWASPDNWCGAPETRAHFVVSSDSKSALFEGDGGLWLADLSAAPDSAAARVAERVAACEPPCRSVTYAFQP
jgi:hypothetical protein